MTQSIICMHSTYLSYRHWVCSPCLRFGLSLPRVRIDCCRLFHFSIVFRSTRESRIPKSGCVIIAITIIFIVCVWNVRQIIQIMVEVRSDRWLLCVCFATLVFDQNETEWTLTWTVNVICSTALNCTNEMWMRTSKDMKM